MASCPVVRSRLAAPAAVVLVLVLGVAALAAWALESREVVVLRTFDADGRTRATRVWIAEDASGSRWIEAASPERPWLHDIAARPEVELERSGATERCRAVPVPGEESHRLVRRLLREKYGLRDVLVGFLADTSRSVGVRLDPPASLKSVAPGDARPGSVSAAPGPPR